MAEQHLDDDNNDNSNNNNNNNNNCIALLRIVKLSGPFKFFNTVCFTGDGKTADCGNWTRWPRGILKSQ
jgi:hypothetical protein